MSENVIAIVGPGAVGALLAALLDRAGSEIIAVARPATAGAINAEGLTIHSQLFGDGVSHIHAQRDIPAGARIIVATKSFAIPEIAAAIGAAHPVEVISFLNGIEHMDALRLSAPGVPVTGASIAVEAARSSPTVIEHRSPFLRITVAAAAADYGIVGDLRRAGLSVTVGGSESEVLWTKLRFLAPMALLTSYWHQPIGEALQHDKGLTSRLLAEVAAIATADGVPTTTDQLFSVLTGFPPAMRSSLQADLAAGNVSELDAIGGALIRRGQSHGIAASTLDQIVDELATR